MNDIFFQHVIDLLNFSGEYCSASKRGGYNVPRVVFGDTYADNHKTNSTDKKIGYDHINKDVPESMAQAIEKTMEDFQCEVKKWYRSNSRLKLDHVLS